MNEIVTFNLDNILYGIEIKSIKEILSNNNTITKLPNTSNNIKGLINLRGEVVPILDLRKIFNLPLNTNQNYSIIIIQTEDKRLIGLFVDKVNNIINLNINENSINKNHSFSMINTNYIKELVKDDNNMYIILNIDTLLSKNEILNLAF